MGIRRAQQKVEVIRQTDVTMNPHRVELLCSAQNSKKRLAPPRPRKEQETALDRPRSDLNQTLFWNEAQSSGHLLRETKKRTPIAPFFITNMAVTSLNKGANHLWSAGSGEDISAGKGKRAIAAFRHRFANQEQEIVGDRLRHEPGAVRRRPLSRQNRLAASANRRRLGRPCLIGRLRALLLLPAQHQAGPLSP